KDRKVAVPPSGQLPALHLLDLGRAVGKLGSIRSKEFCPFLPRLRTARSDTSGKVFVDAIRNKKLRIFRPAIGALTQADFIVSKGLAMCRGSVLLVRRTVTYMAVQNDERRAVFRFSKSLESMINPLEVVGVAYTQNVPVVGQKSRLHILRESDARLTLNGDMIVVVNPGEIIEPQMAGQ